MYNFHPLEVVNRVSETQLQVGENSNWCNTYHDHIRIAGHHYSLFVVYKLYKQEAINFVFVNQYQSLLPAHRIIFLNLCHTYFDIVRRSCASATKQNDLQYGELDCDRWAALVQHWNNIGSIIPSKIEKRGKSDYLIAFRACLGDA